MHYMFVIALMVFGFIVINPLMCGLEPPNKVPTERPILLDDDSADSPDIDDDSDETEEEDEEETN